MPAANPLLTLAALAVVVGGMKIAAPLLVPLLLAVFIAILIASPYALLQRYGVPRAAALAGVLLVLGGALVLVGSVIGASAAEFSAKFPLYQTRLRAMTAGLLGWLNQNDVVFSNAFIAEHFDPGAALGAAAAVVGGMQNLLANGFLILIAVIFILLEAPDIPDKWRAARGDADEFLARAQAAMRKVNHYMAIKAGTSLLTGLLIAAALWGIGVDYPLLWGVLAFLLNFIPNIGSVIAAIPVVLLALVQLGPGGAALTAAAYAAVNILIGTVLEPRVMGRGLGLSTLVVFMSLILWGWVLGAAGMLLSVPLTIALRIALAANENTRWLAILLGPAVTPPKK